MDDEPIASQPEHDREEEIRAWMRQSIRFGMHVDDHGLNEGAPYVVAQVLECIIELGLDNSRATLIFVAGLCVEEHIRTAVIQRHTPGASYSGWTYDLPWAYNDTDYQIVGKD